MNNEAIELVHTAVNNEAETMTREQVNGEWHYLAAWDHVNSYTDGTAISVEEFQIAFRSEFPWFDPTVR